MIRGYGVSGTSVRVGEALRLIRQIHDVNQTSMAKQLGISNSYLCEIEKGNKEPSLSVLDRYAQILNLRTSDIVLFCEDLARTETANVTATSRIAKLSVELLSRIVGRGDEQKAT
jgi:transcriptional regulator with XRE-family HTH domain